MTVLQFAGIWDESASPIGHGNVSSMYGLDPCVLYPDVFVAGPNKRGSLGCAEIPTTPRPAIWCSLKIVLETIRQCDRVSCAHID